MHRVIALLAALLAATAAEAATHTVYWAAATGGTYYAFPSTQSLDDWTTYRVQLSEGVGANVGRYTGSLDDAHGTSWFLFSGASQPASWGASVGATTLVVKANAVKIEDADLDTQLDAIQAIIDLLNTAQAEPTGVPAANETPLDKLAYVFMMLRNKVTVTADTKTYFDDGGAAEFKKGLTDNGTTYTEAEAAAP